jgi:hypothetical protein
VICSSKTAVYIHQTAQMNELVLHVLHTLKEVDKNHPSRRGTRSEKEVA